jgi:PAS domain S-box-containing protein
MAPTPASPLLGPTLAGLTCSVERLLQDLQHCEAIRVATIDSAGHVLSWNAGAQRLLGYRPEEVCGHSLETLLSNAELTGKEHESWLERLLREHSSIVDGWGLQKDGSRIRIRTTLNRLHEGEASRGVFLAFLCPSAPAGIPDAGHPLPEQLIAGVTDYAIFALDPSGRVASWNDGARNIKGFQSHEIIGKHFSCFYPSDAKERGWPEYELRAATTEGRFEDEGWRIRKDGSCFWANVVITAIRDERGKLLGFCKITRDLTSQRRRDEQLRQSEQRLRALMETLTDRAIFMLDPEGFISSWSSGSEKVLGYRAEEIMWKHFSNLYRTEDIAADVPWRELAQAVANGTYETEGWRMGKDRHPVRARVILRALYSDEDKPCGYAHILSTTPTDRLPAEAMSQMRSHLLPLRNAIELMYRKDLSAPVAPALLQTIHREAEALSELIEKATSRQRV